jgi:hypothetical protein
VDLIATIKFEITGPMSFLQVVDYLENNERDKNTLAYLVLLSVTKKKVF